MNIKEIVVDRSFPSCPEGRFEVFHITYKVDLEPEENRLEQVWKLVKEMDVIVREYSGVDKLTENKIEGNTVKESGNGIILKEPVVTTGPEKDNTQRIREVKALIPNELTQFVDIIYVDQEDRLCVKSKYMKNKSDFVIFAGFMKTLDAEYISAGKETRWRLP